MPKVSVIIPVYNVIEYLPRTVLSARTQTEQDIEIILVDDGSTDGSEAMCDAFAKEDARICVIHKENGGLSSARNTGVNVAEGRYILLLDGDDRLQPEAVARTLTVAEKTGADLVQFRYWEVPSEDESILSLTDGEETVTCTAEELFRNLYRLGGEGASACTKLFRREVLQSIPFEDVRHEDELWCTRAFAKPLRAAYIDDILYDYVQRPGSIVRSGFSMARLDTLLVSEERIKVLTELNLSTYLREEYRRLFLAILRLYRDAANAGETEAIQRIRAAFQRHKERIRALHALQGKFALQFCLMCASFWAAELYRLYWKIKGDQ